MMEWQWHQLDHMQVICTSLQTDNHASTSSLNFFTCQMLFLMPYQQHQSMIAVCSLDQYTSKTARLYCERRLSSLERRDLQASIRNQKERNMVLSRLNGELNQELQEVMEQRIALEIQMEHLRPYHS